MIARYTREIAGRIWEDQNRFQKWLDVELAVCEAQAVLGLIPGDALKKIKETASFDVDRILEIEEEVKHDVIAFLTNVAEYVGEESRFIHLGMTSSDVLDTALALQMREAGGLIRDGLEQLGAVLSRRALEFKDTVMIGRSHGVHAEPITFGLKLALWYDENRRNQGRLDRAIETISVGQVSGAVGTFEHLDPRVEEKACEILGLKNARISSQILQRDRHAEYLTTLAIIASSLEKFSTEIRALQKTEVLEAEEYFSKGQKGSSAMPHKRNPITCERIAGMSRIVRGNALAGLENISLWHERDITHSSVERVILPDSSILLDYMIARFTDIMDKLLVYPQNMKKNLDKTRGLVFSQRVLLALARKGLTREAAYKIVQENAMKVWNGEADSFRALIENDPGVHPLLSSEELDECFDPAQSLRHVDYIFKRVGIG